MDGLVPDLDLRREPSSDSVLRQRVDAVAGQLSHRPLLRVPDVVAQALEPLVPDRRDLHCRLGTALVHQQADPEVLDDQFDRHLRQLVVGKLASAEWRGGQQDLALRTSKEY